MKILMHIFRGGHPFIGLTKVNNVWMYNDGDVPDSIPWQPGHPNAAYSCAISDSHGKAQSWDCNSQKKGVCETKASGKPLSNNFFHFEVMVFNYFIFNEK